AAITTVDFGLHATPNTPAPADSGPATSVPVAGSHTRTMPASIPACDSLLAEISALPSEANAKLATGPGVFKVCTFLAPLASQTITVPSALPLANRLPSGANAAAWTTPPWSLRVVFVLPAARSQTTTVLSAPPEIRA